ncbi:MAG: hypothetical protein K6G92_05340 [Bacteroidaceae bacterium]|nr:hypothetical protein [Bacteroidaceae bacterium]
MIILIDRKRAVLKKGTSFEFISENRFFTGADSYTLSITFPIRGCAENIAIFGHIYRKDFNFDTELLDCEIHDRNFHKYGSVSIVSVSETEVKTQFLEGRSATNFHSSMDDIYINEIRMPTVYADAQWDAGYYLRTYGQQMMDDEEEPGDYLGFVCPPWVNNTSGNIQNKMEARNNDFYYTGGSPNNDPTLVGFPFLVEVIRQVLQGAGYECDLSAIEDSQWADLIVCQGFPVVWQMGMMNEILPHWTVSEFLEQVELFLNGTFELEGKSNRMTFSFNSRTISRLEVVRIERVVDSHSVDIAKEEDVRDSYIEQKNLAFQDCDHQMWKFYSCDWATSRIPMHVYDNYASMKSQLDSLLDCAGPMNAWQYRYIHFCREEDTCFVLKCDHTATVNNVIHHYMHIQPVNMFRPRIMNGNDNAEVVELGIVPACIDFTDNVHGSMLFVECGTLGEDETDAEDRDGSQTQAVNTIEAGEKQKKEEYFDKIFVAFWDGTYMKYYPQMPHPYVDRHEVKPDNTYTGNQYSMRLTGKVIPFSNMTKYQVNQQRKFTFSFLSDSIPDVRSIFLIHGKRYLAEKITATFSAETGMSQLLKMVCYQIIRTD